MIGIYFSGTGNTKHCMELLVSKVDEEEEVMGQQYKYLRLCGIFGIISFLSYLLAVVFSPFACSNLLQRDWAF